MKRKKERMKKLMMKQIKMRKRNGRHIGVLNVTNVIKFFHSSHSLTGITAAHMIRNQYTHVLIATRVWRSILLSGHTVIGMSQKADTGDYFYTESSYSILRNLNIN
jgi:hypothetical protein